MSSSLSENVSTHLTAEMITVALDAVEGKEISVEYLNKIRHIAANNSDRSESRAAKYILCAHAAHHCGFVEPDYFVNLAELLSTDNVIIRQCVMWTFVTILPIKNFLSPLLIRLLFDSLKDETLGWSISYLFRKMSENDKYIPMVPDTKWISMPKLLFDQKLSEQVRTTIVHTLSQVFKIRRMVAPFIKHKFAELVMVDDLPKRLFIATVNALHMMAIGGDILEKKTVDRLRQLATNNDAAFIKCIHELLDFLDHKRVLSNAASFMGNSQVKKELTVSQTMSISRCEEESSEPTSKALSLDHLLSTVGYLDRTFNAEAQPKTVSSGHNQAWYRSTLQEIQNLTTLAKNGQLKDQDFKYLLSSFKSTIFLGWTTWNTRSSMHQTIATAFRDAAKAEQAIPLDIIDEMLSRLIDDKQNVSGLCAETLLIIVKNQQELSDQQMKKVEEALTKANDCAVKQNLIEIYALYISKGYHVKLDLSLLEKNLQDVKTCLTASYLFFKAAAIEKRTFTDQTMRTLCQVGMRNEYDIKARNNCLWALAYSIRETKDKQSISSELIDDLTEILISPDTNVKQTTAVALCYYGMDENIVLSAKILERLAVMLSEKDQTLLDNIVSLYQKMSKKHQIIPVVALENLARLLQHPEFSLRQRVIWTFKHVVDDGQDLSMPILALIDLCLDDQESHIRNPAGRTFITYWQGQLVRNDSETIRHVSARLEKLLILFQRPYELQVRILALEFLRQLIEKDYDIPESILQLIEMCLYDREAKISIKTIAVVESYSRRRPLRRVTIVCLEHLLTTETPILPNIIAILKTIVGSGHILSKKVIDILGQLILKANDPNDIVILLTFADRYQPLPKSIDELLRQIYFAKVLKYSTHQSAIYKAVAGLVHLTQQGQQLSLFVLNTLFDLLKSANHQSSLIPIILNVISNGQHINNNEHRALLDQIFRQSGNHPSHDLMLIFTQLSRQNQAIPDSVIDRLEKLLDNPSINLFVIEIYQHLIERRKPLDSSVIRRVLKWFEMNLWKDLSMDFRYRLTSFFNTLANNRPNDADQIHLPSLLQVQQPTTILRELCSAIHTLAVHCQHLHSTTINALFLLLDGEIDTDIQEIILKTLHLVQSNSPNPRNDLKEFLDVFDHDPNLDDQTLLKQLRDTVKSGMKLPEAYLTRLSHMLYSCDLSLKGEAATILALTLSSSANLSKKVLDAIYLTLLDESISVHTLPLLLSSTSTWPSSVIDDLLHLVQHSKKPTIQQRAKQFLITQKERNVKVREFLDNQSLLLSKTQHEHVQKMILSPNINDVQQALKIIRAMIILEKHVPHKMLSTIVNQLAKHPNEIIDVLILAFTHDIQFNAKLSQSIENTLSLCQTERMLVLIRIMTEKSIPFQEKTFEILLSQVDSNVVNEPLLCLENITRYQQLPTHFISYFVEQLSQGSDDIIGKSFNILRLQISQGYVKYSQELLQSIPLPSIIDRDRLAKETTVQQCLGTIQTLLFVEYLEPKTFELPATQWSRQCLCIDLFTRCPDQSFDQILNFYHQLTQFEISKQCELYNDQCDDFLRALIEKQRSYDFNLATINQILIYSKTPTDQSMKLLQSKEDNWLFRMRLHFIQSIFNQWSFNTLYSQTVLNHLIERVSKEENLPAELIEPFLQFVQTPDNILMILDLVTTYQITGDQLISIFANRKSLDRFESLQRKIELMIINKTLPICASGSEEQFKSACHDLQVLLENGWRLSKLIDLLHSIELHQNVFDSLSQFLRSLQILIDYKMNENALNSLKEIFSHENVQSWSANVHALVIEHRFGSISSEKNLSTLLAEIKQVNPDIDVIRFEEMFAQIDQAYEYDSSRFPQNESIKNWNISEIQAWAIKVLKFQSTNSNRLPLSEILAVIKRAVYLDSHFEPRPIQILAVLIMLDCNEQGGRLLQILTGEGKSTVVSILAVIKALQGQHVDIITSAMTLAKRDAHEREKFYKYFEIQVSHNNDETSYVFGPKACYAAIIVYGTSSQFQFDLLRHEFSLLSTRTINNSTGATRRHDVIIIDEVDSMLIDENSTIARLADQLPGMEWLNSSLYGVWRSVEADADVVSNRDFIVKNLKELFLDSESQIKIPKHLHRFVIDSLPTWIDHAIRAKVEYRLDHHYMIKPDETRTKRIMPIDFSNTGVIQSSTTWSDGLHQFLQIKHGLKLTPLTVTTNYLSNVGLFTRYGTQVYGLTGTIGSKDAQNLLQKIYNVDTIIIPPFKEKRHILLDPVLTMNDDQWLNIIVSNSLNHVRNHRAILIICETRLDAKTINTELRRADPTCSIRLYTDSTDAVESNAVNDKMQPGEVIVATNLAGRGTDLKTSPEVEKHGGLHVCLTFLPNNLRVEEQAFGRTSRQGNRGTSQMILCQDRTLRQLMSNDPSLFDTNLTDTSEPMTLFRYWRAQAERAHLDRIWTEEISDIKLKDELFKKFCQLLVQLRTLNNDPYRLLSAKEQWGLWLKSMDYAAQNRKALQQVIKTVGYQYEEMPRDDDSFYHAISHQLEGKLNAKDIKQRIMKHIEENKNLYTEMNDEQRHSAASRALEVSIIIYRSDYGGPCVYEQENALAQCFLGYEVDSYYVSLKQSTKENKPSTTQPKESEEKPLEKETTRHTKWFNNMKNLAGKMKDWGQNLVDRSATQVSKLDLDVGFEQLKNQIEKDFKTDDIIKNPCYLMLDADTMMQKLFSWSNTFQYCLSYIPYGDTNSVSIDQVMNRLEQAFNLDPVFAFDALTSYSLCLLHQGKLPGEYKTTAKSYLTKAQKQIGEYILPQLYSMQLKSTTDSEEFVFDDFATQLQIKVDILQLYLSHVSNAITVIEESQKLINITDTDGTTQKIGRKLYNDEVKKFLDNCSGSIDIGFNHLKVHHDCGRDDQAVDLFEILTDDERVSIHFVETSLEAIKKITDIPEYVTVRLNIQYLDAPEVIQLMENRSADLTLMSTAAANYLAAIEIMNTNVTIITDTSRQVLSSSEAKTRVATQNESIKSILFPLINVQNFEKIHEKMDKVPYALTFQSLTISQMKKMVETLGKPFSVELYSLTTKQATFIAKKIDDRQNFMVTVLNLAKKRAQAIVKSFSPNEENVKASFTRLADQFSKTDQPHEELNTYNVLGIRVLIIVDELGPRPWISASVVVALGVGQMIGGVYLAAVTCGLGTSLGISLIGEGINDIVYGVRGAISRRFSWKDYGIQKGVSLTICFVTLGCSAVKQAAQAAAAAGTTGTTAMLKATGRGTMTVMKNSFRTVGSGAIKGISSNSWKLACKQVAVTCLETGVRQIANYAADSVSNKALSEFTDSIRTEIERILLVEQSELEYKRVVNRAIDADKFNGNKQWRQQMEQIASQLMSKQKSEYVEALKSLSGGVTNAILNHSRQYLHGQNSSVDQYLKITQLAMTLLPMIKGSHELATITDKFFAAYKQELKLLEQKIPTFQDLLILQSNQSISMEEATRIYELLVSKEILSSTSGFNSRFFILIMDQPDFVGQVSSSQSNTDQLIRSFQDKLSVELASITFDSETQRTHVVDLLSKLLKPEQKPLSLSMMNKKIIDFFVEQVCAIIKGTFITPLTNFIVSNSILMMSTKIQLAMDPNGTVTEQLVQEGAQRYLNVVVNDMFEKIKSGEIKIDPEGRKKLEELQRRTENDPGKAKSYSEKLALDMMNGKQGDNVVLSVLAMITQTPVTVLQTSSNDASNQDPDNPNVQLNYTLPKIDKTTGALVDGHYESAQSTVVTAGAGPTDCLFAAVLSQMPDKFQSIDDMRAQCAAFILTTPNFIEGIYPAVSVINQCRTPLRRKLLMGEGATLTLLQEKRIQTLLAEIYSSNPEEIKKLIEEYMDKASGVGNDGQTKEDKSKETKSKEVKSKGNDLHKQGEHVFNKGLKDIEQKLSNILGTKDGEVKIGLDENIFKYLDIKGIPKNPNDYKNENAARFGLAKELLMRLAEKHKQPGAYTTCYSDAFKSVIDIIIDKEMFFDAELNVDKKKTNDVRDAKLSSINYLKKLRVSLDESSRSAYNKGEGENKSSEKQANSTS